MKRMQVPERPQTSAELTGREIRRLADLVLSSDVQRSMITPLSRMIPGLSREDARLVRDEVIRRRIAKGDRSAILIGRDVLDPVILSERIVSATPARISTGSVPLWVRGVVGLRVGSDSIRSALRGQGLHTGTAELQLGLEVARLPFGHASVADSDVIAVNGGVSRLVSSISHTHVSAASEFRMLRDGTEMAAGTVPAADVVRQKGEDVTVRAIRCCIPLAELFEAAAPKRPGPETFVAIGLGEPIALTSNSTVELEVAGARVAAIIADTDHFM